MKKTILLTSLAYALIACLVIGCEKPEDEPKEKSCAHAQARNLPFGADGEAEIMAKAVQSPTDDNIFTWYYDVTDACPAKSTLGEFELYITDGQQTNIDVNFNRVISGPGKNYYGFYPEAGAVDASTGWYRFQATTNEQIVCTECPEDHEVKISLAIQIKITGPGITDHKEWVRQNVKKIRFEHKYSVPWEAP